MDRPLSYRLEAHRICRYVIVILGRCGRRFPSGEPDAKHRSSMKSLKGMGRIAELCVRRVEN
jgi:hypothetical protein